ERRMLDDMAIHSVGVLFQGRCRRNVIHQSHVAGALCISPPLQPPFPRPAPHAPLMALRYPILRCMSRLRSPALRLAPRRTAGATVLGVWEEPRREGSRWRRAGAKMSFEFPGSSPSLRPSAKARHTRRGYAFA